ncbi:MAG: hypothetical protein Fur0015_05010 [Ignavibacteriales bacterium]
MMKIEYPHSKTMWNRWITIAEKFPKKEAIVHWIAGEEPVRWTYKNLIETANNFSIKLFEHGIRPNDVCAIIMKHNPYFYPLYLGIVGAGAIPSVLAYPNPRLHPDKFKQGLSGMSKYSGLDVVITQIDLEETLKPFIESGESTIRQILFPLEWNLKEHKAESLESVEKVREQISETDAFLLQHSSGTTGLQKPVVISHKALLDHISQYSSALELSHDDKVVSWLPLYHDMGLIGAFHLPLASGVTSIQIDTFEWILAPNLLFEVTSKEKATMCWLPNFAYNLMADKIREDEMENIDLSSFRMIINASEPIRAESHHKFLKAFEKYNLKPSALSTLYGMAEVTLALSQNPPGKKITELVVDRQKLAEGKLQLADESTKVKRVCVSSGILIPDTELKLVDENRNTISGDCVGEIAVKSIALFDGYKNNPEKTREVLEDGWYYTGDIGFVYDNEVYVIGRKKDIIIFAGKNIYPEDIEDVINQVPDVIHGRIIAFGEDNESLGTETISVVAETNLTDEKELHRLKIEIIKAGMSIDVNIYNVYLVPPRWLIKSSSGKPARKTNKERILAGTDKSVWVEKRN